MTNGGIRLIFRVVYFWMNPFPLVIGIVNDLGFPLSLILQVWYQRPFPLPIHCLIPVLWLFGIRVWDEFSLPGPQVSYLQDPLLADVHPFPWFLGIGVFDLPGRQEGPVILQIPSCYLLVVYFDLISSIRVNNQSVQVSVFMIL